jgi:hypothetical protein
LKRLALMTLGIGPKKIDLLLVVLTTDLIIR